MNLSAQPTRYVILTNPASGRMTVEQKRSALREAASVLGAEIYGLDIPTIDGLVECARELSKNHDIIVVAGGDGTLSDIINAIDTAQKPIAYLPLGSGNAMRHALGYRGRLAEIAAQIRQGVIHEFDLVDCDGRRRAVTAAIGIEGPILQLRDQFLAKGITGFHAYIKAVLVAYFWRYKRTLAEMALDGVPFEAPNLLTLIITKHPYYGYGMKLLQKASFDDGRLHALWVNSGLWTSLYGVLTAFTIGNRIGKYMTCQELGVRLQSPMLLQTDGNKAWESDCFTFRILPKALKIKF